MSFDYSLFPPLFANYEDLLQPEIDDHLLKWGNRVEDLAQRVMDETMKQLEEESVKPKPLAKRRKMSIFTEAQDLEIIACKTARLDSCDILAALGEESGFTKEQLDSRCRYLAASHPELRAILLAKKVKKFELTKFDEKLVRNKLKGIKPLQFAKRYKKTLRQINYRWSQLEQKAPEFIQSIKEQMIHEEQDEHAVNLMHLDIYSS